MSNHAILGVASNATEEQITAAYRKLAMKHHPDREGGSKDEFQRIQAAYSQLQATGFAPHRQPQQNHRSAYGPPETPGGTWRDRVYTDPTEAFDRMKRPQPRQAPNNGIRPEDEIVARVSMREAFAGFNMQIPRQRANGLVEYVHVNVPAGTPDGHRGAFKLSDGTTQMIITRIEKSDYVLRGFVGGDNLFTAGLVVGDIEYEVEVDALDIIMGSWIKVRDFLNEELSVRIPAGFNPRQRLKVANKGYAGWSDVYNEPSKTRRDMYLKLTPIFNKPQDLDPAKVEALYNSTRPTDVDNA